MSNVITSIEVDYDARLVEAAESIANALERIVELIEKGIEKEDEQDV